MSKFEKKVYQKFIIIIYIIYMKMFLYFQKITTNKITYLKQLIYLLCPFMIII